MKNKKIDISYVVLIIVGTILVTAATTKQLSKTNTASVNTNGNNYSYNGLTVTGTPINNGEFIFGGGTYRDVNLKLKLKIPVGWSIGLGGSGNLAENEFELDPVLRITSNNQAFATNGNSASSASYLVESLTIEGTKYYRKGAGPANFNTYASYEDAVNTFAKSKDDKYIISFKDQDILLANKYKAHRFDIEYTDNSPMRFRTLVFIDHKAKLYSIDTINTDFYNSPKVQEMLNSIEFIN